jgi:hypothetical protein
MVIVEVRDPDGRVVKRVTANEEAFRVAQRLTRESENDLLTLWIYRIIKGLLTPAVAGQTVSDVFTDTGGTSRTGNIKYAVSGNIFNNTTPGSNRPWISYGNSNTPPTRTDFRLGNKLNEAVPSFSFDESARTVTLTVGWTLTADTTIYEVGLEWEMYLGVQTRILVDRTVFPDGITVRAGQTLTITYVVSVP